LKPSLVVAAGVLIEGENVLISQRRANDSLGGCWEFPGGKVEAGEDPRLAVTRELQEEVGLDVQAGEILDVTFHAYGDKSVLLLFFEVARLHPTQEPQALDVAAVRWARVEDLVLSKFPPADGAILAKVRARLLAAKH
jgi:8-oxo-dGTP diphosphatase